jgi:peptidyl-prolyl cis-trans isomerase C
MAKSINFSRGNSMRQRIICVLLIGLAVSSCQKKAQGQTVAVVNGEEITASELNDAMSNDTSLGSSSTKDARAIELKKLVDRKLLVQQAKTDGLDKSPEFINQQRRGTEDLLINLRVSKQVYTAQLPSADEIARFEASRPEMFAGREIWTLQQIVYPLPQNAQVTAKLNAAKSLDEIAQALTAAGVQFNRNSKKIDTALFPHPVYGQIAALPQGEPFIVPGPDKAIANVISNREPTPLAADQARSVALSAMRREQAQKVVDDRVKSLLKTAKIEYQPGYAPPAK